jgi:hypothetical protein
MLAARRKEASRMRTLTWLFSLLLGGGLLSACVVQHDHIVNGVPPTCDLPSPVAYSSGFTQLDVKGGASASIPGSTPAYAITTNGVGTYSLNWTDPSNLGTCFTGRITSNVDFNQAQVVGVTGRENILLVAPNQIGFASAPGATVDGVNFFLPKDPVYIDVFADDSPSVTIYYTDAGTNQLTADTINPVAFQSP